MSASRHILSYGAGVNTTALMIHLLRNGMPFDEAIFADTGAELPETYESLRVARRYLASHGVPLRVVRSGKGTLYGVCRRRRVVPSMIWRWSTRDFKVIPIHAYYRTLGTHVNEYLGIAYDEIIRMKASRVPYATSLFPLVDAKLTRADCIELIQAEGLPVPVKSGCYFCPFNSAERWKYVLEHHPRLYGKAIRLEEGSKHFPSQKLTVLSLRGFKGKQLKPEAESIEIEPAPCGAYCMS